MKKRKTESKLASFLYEIMRDHVAPGKVEKVAQDSMAPDVTCSNGYLAEYAEDVAARLYDEEDCRPPKLKGSYGVSPPSDMWGYMLEGLRYRVTAFDDAITLIRSHHERTGRMRLDSLVRLLRKEKRTTEKLIEREERKHR